MPRPARAWLLVRLLMLLSGFAGLGYQIVWTQQSSLWLGHESAAVLAVVTAFFGGLALGALGLGARIERSAQPARWYAACEVLIAAWSLVLAALLDPASRALLAWTGAQPTPAWQATVAFAGCFLLLLPATAAMGATLPAMERLAAAGPAGGRSIAGLYAANTAGAVLGVLAAAFWLVPAWGLQRTAGLCAALNLACAGLAWFGLPRSGAGPVAPPAMAPPAAAWAGRAALLRLALTGLLGIGYEVLVVRVLSQVSEDTVYTFAMLLAVYLVGTALGAALYAAASRRWGPRVHASTALRNALLAALAAACLLGGASLWAAELIKAACGDLLGPGLVAALAAEAMLAVAAFALPTLLMGALFSQLSAQAAAQALPFGRALGVNTLGAAAAPLVVGVLLVPALGPKAALLLLVLGYLLLSTWQGLRRAVPALALAGVVAALALQAPPLAFVDVPEGGRIVSYREGAMAAVSVVEDAEGVSRLRINNRQQEGSSASALFDGRQALLPLLLHAAPRQALFLGLGTGVTARTAAREPGLQVDAVELLPEVIAAAPHFSAGEAPAALQVLAADARRFVRASERRYDVIVADNFHPARGGSGALYTVEHFAAVRQRLAPGGLFCQWLPLHQLDLETVRSIVQSFRAVYPGALLMLAANSLQTPTIGLVGRSDGRGFDAAALARRLQQRADAGLREPGLQNPAAYGVDDVYALLGSFIAGPPSLAALAGDAPLNTDDHPVVAYRAPRATYAPDSLPAERLLALLQFVSLQPAELLAGPADAALAARLQAYGQARKAFLQAGRAVRPVADPAAMLAQVQAPLLGVLRTSPDFRPAYDPLLRLAGAVGRSDPAAARDLLLQLQQLQPARPEAGQQLQALQAVPAR